MMPFFVLAKIESRFRVDSKIEHGNTLTDDKFFDDEFDVVIANPPYGVDWKGFQKDILKDKTQGFQYFPSVTAQPCLVAMPDRGKAISVNGCWITTWWKR